MEDNEGFHLRDGLFFKRLDDENIRIRKYKTAHFKETEIIFEMIIDKNSWASIVSTVSKFGENGTSYFEALRFFEDGIEDNRICSYCNKNRAMSKDFNCQDCLMSGNARFGRDYSKPQVDKL